MKKKVLHVINSMMPGGAEILLANSLSQGGLCEHTENHLAYFRDPTYLLERLDKNVQVHFLNYKGTADVVRLLRQLKIIIRDNKIDIVHSHLNPASFYTHLACPGNVRHVHTIHIAYSTDVQTRPVLKLLERKLFFDKKNCNLIFLSEFTKDDFLKAVKFSGKAFILPNFIEDVFFNSTPKYYQGSTSSGLKIIAVGNFRKQKNYFYLLDIFKHLKGHNIHLDIYGGGNVTKYQQFIDDNSINVTLKGQVNNVNAIMPNYDLFIMSSTNEGFPLSVFEAMAAGVPLMLSDIAPLTSIVKNNARYFKLNDPNAVAQQLINILENRIDINEMAVGAKLYAEGVVRRDMYIKKLMNIYQQL